MNHTDIEHALVNITHIQHLLSLEGCDGPTLSPEVLDDLRIVSAAVSQYILEEVSEWVDAEAEEAPEQ